MSIDHTYNLDQPAEEVLAGLPNAQDRLLGALTNQDFYDLDNERYIPRRQAESQRDYQDRPKRTLDLTRQAVDALCRHQYTPPPSRKLEGSDSVNTFLQAIYADQLVDVKFNQAERLSTLNNVCAIQVVATGNDLRPIRYNIWGAEEFEVWVDPEDATQPWAVCVIDRQDAQTRYKLWDANEVRTYETKKVKPGQTADGRTAVETSREDHDYGCLPFVFIHYELPDRKFWSGSPGEVLRRANARIDIRLSELDEAIEKYNLRPSSFAFGIDPNWRPINRPGTINHVPIKGMRELGGSHVGTDPRIDSQTITVDPTAVWNDISEFMYAKLEGVGVPRSAVRMEQSGLGSGIAIVAEQAPLLTRAANRRAMYRVYEGELAKVTLCCAGNHYGKPELVTASEDVRLSLLWPEPSIPIPDLTRDQIDQSGIDMGIKSAVDVVMERYGMTREQAMERLEQVAEDNKFLAGLHSVPAVDSTTGTAAAASAQETAVAPTNSGPADVAEADANEPTDDGDE